LVCRAVQLSLSALLPAFTSNLQLISSSARICSQQAATHRCTHTHTRARRTRARANENAPRLLPLQASPRRPTASSSATSRTRT
jgi:hypothetical protein